MLRWVEGRNPNLKPSSILHYEYMTQVPCKILLVEVFQAVHAFAGERPQFDDITYLTLRYSGREP